MSPATSRSTWRLASKGWVAKRSGEGARLGQEWWKYRAAPWSMAHVRPCHTSRLGFDHVRSTLAVKASSQTIRSARSVGGGIDPS